MVTPSARKFTWALDYKSLMAESEALVHYALVAGTDHQKQIIERLTEKYARYLSWERHHSSLMNKVANSETTDEQAYALRKISVTMVHLGALTRYLKNNEVRGRDRKLLVTSLNSYRDYIDAIVREHATYIRAETSSMCARYLSIKLGDKDLVRWYGRYCSVYDDYFESFCNRIIGQERGVDSPMDALLCLKKAEVEKIRTGLFGWSQRGFRFRRRSTDSDTGNPYNHTEFLDRERASDPLRLRTIRVA